MWQWPAFTFGAKQVGRNPKSAHGGFMSHVVGIGGAVRTFGFRSALPPPCLNTWGTQLRLPVSVQGGPASYYPNYCPIGDVHGGHPRGMAWFDPDR